MCPTSPAKGLAFLNFLLLLAVGTCEVLKSEVPENYGGNFPFYIVKLPKQALGSYHFTLTGDDEGVFGVDSGFLYATAPFDREKHPSYTLQVSVTDKGQPVIDPITIYIQVKDKNDNFPQFTKESMSGIVFSGLGTKSGSPFMQVQATDLDDPATPHADLRYSLVSQAPAEPSGNMFQIHSLTGSVSLTAEGARLLDPEKCNMYHLKVTVKDMGEESYAHTAEGIVSIKVMENTWIPLAPVNLQENQRGPFPQRISQAQWSGGPAVYRLKGAFSRGLFTISSEGVISVTRPLDREAQAEFQIEVFAESPDGTAYADSLTLAVTVGDDNDNAPVFSQQLYQADLNELAVQETEILRVQATDADAPATDNSKIVYRIASQKPESKESLFRMDRESGAITVQAASLHGAATHYTLEVIAEDLAGKKGGHSSTCTVILDIVDVNDRPPVFSQRKYGPFKVPEDTETGFLVTKITASDEDKPGTDSWLVEFKIESGNEGEIFELQADRENNAASVILKKELDFESVQEYSLVLSARNVGALVAGGYGSDSTATVLVQVVNVNEAPVLSQEVYVESVEEGVPAGTVVLTVQGSDPDTPLGIALRYSLKGDTNEWFIINEYTGEIKTARVLDREVMEGTYTMVVVAEERVSPNSTPMSVTAAVTINIKDVNDNYPHLVGDYSQKYMCSLQRENQSIIIGATDRDVQEQSGALQFSFNNDPTVRRNWRLRPINGTHAYLSMGLSYLVPQVYMVPIIITDSGTPRLEKQFNLPVTVCQCSERGNCRTQVLEMMGKPTPLSALGLLFGTLGMLGLVVMIGLAKLKAKSTDNPEKIPLNNSA
ncbi:cadherin-16 isoform X2 [Acipenser ruthenus]|uniref:cadherin-16 isoform X2 n=1 Tax=Acipenser ruthenus TaxID=7906 RepID=UPI00274211BD|nr:cadherin-16 isoform X2 [Acipenser ruthenus]